VPTISPKLNLPADVRSTAFREAAVLIRAEPTLRRAGVRVVTPDDAQFDNELPKDRLSVRLRPELLPTEAASCAAGVRTFAAPVGVHVEIRVPSWAWDDTPNLWRLLVGALLPGTEAGHAEVDPRLTAAGVSWVDGITPPAGFGPDETVVGRFVLMCFVDG
jgi:hypothetical protein